MADRHTTEKLLEGERLSGKVTLFAKVTILPGDELPYHEHHGRQKRITSCPVRVCIRITTKPTRCRRA